MIHDLKIWPVYFERVLDGTKTFEVRNNDRGFQFGDEVILREWKPEETIEAFRYTNRKLRFRVGYVLPIDSDRVVFSLLPLENTLDAEREEK